MKIATIINYCTNDYRFINKSINSVRYFSDQIIVPICDHFYDGTPENMDLINRTVQENNYGNVKFVIFKYEPEKFKTSQNWVTYARVVGALLLNDDIDYVLIMDSDEIVDTLRFNEWLNEFNVQDYNAFTLLQYRYFREPIYQATDWITMTLLCKKEFVLPQYIMHKDDRDATFHLTPSPKIKGVLGLDGKPMIDHYAWVRTKEAMIKKVQTWGHNKDLDWVKLVEEEFSRPFNGKTFFTTEQYITVENKYKF